MSLSKGDQMKLDMEHVVQCPMCMEVFPEADVHPDDQLCIECEGKWVESYTEILLDVEPFKCIDCGTEIKPCYVKCTQCALRGV